jgi:hypothetical protein
MPYGVLERAGNNAVGQLVKFITSSREKQLGYSSAGFLVLRRPEEPED